MPTQTQTQTDRSGQIRSGTLRQACRSDRWAVVDVGVGWICRQGAGRWQVAVVQTGRQAHSTHTHRAEWLFGGYLRYSLSKID